MSRFTLGKDDKEGSLYDLFAVANHSGTVNFGHYTAFGRLAERDYPTDGLRKSGLGNIIITVTIMRVCVRQRPGSLVVHLLLGNSLMKVQ